MGEDPALGRRGRSAVPRIGGDRAGGGTIGGAGAIAIAAAVVAAAAPPPPALRPEALARPGLLARLADGRKINFRCVGSGRPTVVLEAGYGANSLAWTAVQPLLAPRFRACAYDRAGYGFSDPGPLPRDGAAIARDLDEALRAARIGGPYILVGHSAGGLYVRLLAARRPGAIAGMVLVDPTVEHQDARYAAAFGPGAGSLAPQHMQAERCLAAAEAGALPSSDTGLAACAPAPKAGEPTALAAEALREARRPSGWETQLSELDSLMTTTSDEVVASPASYGDLPLIVLTAAGAHASPSTRPEALWNGLHAELAARSSRGEHRRVAGSSHLMMWDRPDAIAAAVADVAAAASPVSRRPGGTRR